MDIPDFAGLSHIADFRLKCSIEGQNSKITTSGSTEAMKDVHLNKVKKRLKDYGSKMVAESKKGLKLYHLTP
jgi:hypothetical protein